MKKLLWFFFCGMLVTLQATSIPAGNVSGTWDAAGNPYEIMGDISVANGDSLLIQAGVEVILQGFYSITIDGQITCSGTATDSIHFYAATPDIGWNGIRFDNTPDTNPPSLFDHVIFQHGKKFDGYSSGAQGGALWIKDYDGVEVRDCHFLDNQAKYGGAMHLRNSSIVVSHTLFSNNYCEFSGGAVRCHTGGVSLFTDCQFMGNSSGSGSPVLYCYQSDPVLINCILQDNVADGSGGAVTLDNGSPLLINNVIAGNTATGFGGGISMGTNCSPTLVNCTVADNSAEFGGGMYVNFTAHPSLINCILWGNTAIEDGMQVHIGNPMAQMDFDYCDVQGGSSAFTGAAYTGIFTNTMDADPGFDPQLPYRLQSTSPCVNAGRPDTTGMQLPSLDPDGNQRIMDVAIDMGAYEFQGVANQPPLVVMPLEDLAMFEDTTNESIDLNAVFQDPDGDPLTFDVAGNQFIAVTISTGIVSLVPEENWFGTEELVFTASDDLLRDNVSDTLLVTVMPLNDPPYIVAYAPDSLTIYCEVNETIDFSISGMDIDNTDLEYSWKLNGQNLGISDSTYSFTSEIPGTHTVAAYVSDGILSDSVTWYVTLSQGNMPPEIISYIPGDTLLTADLGTELGFSVTAQDPEGEPLSYMWLVNEEVQSSTLQEFSYTASQLGQQNIRVAVFDGIFTTSLTWHINVVEVSANPTIPAKTQINSLFPNPFNPQTRISFTLAQSSQIALKAYNSSGQMVAQIGQGFYAAGMHTASWDGKDDTGRPVASGLYLICLEVNGTVVHTAKAMLLK